MNENVKIALMYDFDKTLCTKDMQEYTFIPKLSMSAKEFWSQSNKWSKTRKMDKILAYMYTMLREAKHNDIAITRESFRACGENIEYFPGVIEWFSYINTFGLQNGIDIEHYIISSGLKEIIEGSEIGGFFKEIFACEFFYDVNSVAVWPLNVVNYTGKTQYLYRINKGVLDISNDDDLNASTPEDDRPIPFRNMIYFGDGMTDVPCMKLVHINGGKSIAVYPEGDEVALAKTNRLLQDNRVDYVEAANYSKGSELAGLVESILLSMVANHRLIEMSKTQLKTI